MPLATAGWRAREHWAFVLELNDGHLAGWMLDPRATRSAPHTIPLDLERRPASTRSGRLRAAVADSVWRACMSGSSWPPGPTPTWS
jgi:hypothetical protein